MVIVFKIFSAYQMQNFKILTLFLKGTTLNGKKVMNALIEITKNFIIVSEQTTIQIKFHVSILCMLVDKNIKLFCFN